MWLGSRNAVAQASGYSLDQTPSLWEPPYAVGAALEKIKKKKNYFVQMNRHKDSESYSTVQGREIEKGPES